MADEEEFFTRRSRQQREAVRVAMEHWDAAQKRLEVARARYEALRSEFDSHDFETKGNSTQPAGVARDGTKAGGTWNARFSLDDPGGNGLLLDGASPEVRLVAADLSETTFPAKPDGNGYYEATVKFPSAGTYAVEAVGFDPRDPSRFVDTGPPVVIDPAASTATRAPSDDGFPWALLAIAALALLAAVAARRFVRPASRTAR